MTFPPGTKVVALNDRAVPPKIGTVLRLKRVDPIETLQGVVDRIEV